MPIDPRTATLLAHKGSPVPLEPMPWPQRPEPRYGTFHDAAPVDPSHQHQGSRTGGAHQYERGPMSRLGQNIDPLRPLYTEKLAKSPHYPSLAEAAQRRRDFWNHVGIYTGIALMVAASIIAFWYGTGIFPAGAFVVGLITFVATCFYSGCRNRNRIA